MKLFGALITSLMVHGLVVMWKSTVEPEISGSAGQAILNIQQMRFVTASKEISKEYESELEEIVEVDKQEDRIEIEPVINPVQQEVKTESVVLAADKEVARIDDSVKKTKPVTTKLKKENREVKQEQVKKIMPELEKKLGPTKTEKIEFLNKPEKLKQINTDSEQQEKRPVEQVANNTSEQDDDVEELEVSQLKDLTKNETKTNKPVITPEVISTTDTVAVNNGFDHIPTMSEPRYRKAFPPEYPRLAKKRGQQGLVLLRAKIDQKGEVEMVEILQSSGVKSLDNRALETVEQWLFYPYTIEDEPTVAWVNIPVDFTLK